MTYALSAMLLFAAAANSPSPTTLELAKAISEFKNSVVSANDVRRPVCRGIEEEPTEAVCTWQQRQGSRWQRFTTYVAVDARGWHLIDEPAPAK